MRSKKVRYTTREDTVLSLPVPMDAVLNKGMASVVSEIQLLVELVPESVNVLRPEEIAAYEEKKAQAEEKKETL